MGWTETDVLTRVRHCAGVLLCRVWQLRPAAVAAQPAADVVLGVDAASGGDRDPRAGADGGAVQPLRVAVARDADPVTSSFVDDVQSSLLLVR